MGLEPQRILLLASAVATLFLAVLLAGIDFEKRVNRAFAALLALRALSPLVLLVSSDPRWALFAVGVQPYFLLAALPAALYFASVYPRRRGPLARPGGGWIALTAALALDGLYLLRHEWYQAASLGEATGASRAAAGVRYEAFGPLAFVGFLTFPVLAGLALLFVRDYTRSPAGTTRTSYFLVAAGFLLNGLFDGAARLVSLVHLLQDTAGFPWAPWGWSVIILPTLSLPIALAALGVMAHHRFRGRAQELPMENRLYVLSGLALASGLLPFLFSPSSDLFRHPATLVLLGLWRLTLPAFVTYALLRYALFDIDLRVRSAVAWSIVAATFGATYFLVSELMEGVVASRLGTAGGLGAAALLTLATRPLASFGRRTARFLMPGVREPRKASHHDGEEIYRQQFLMVQEDGSVTEKERRSLEHLRERLGLVASRARSIERAVSAGARAGTAPA